MEDASVGIGYLSGIKVALNGKVILERYRHDGITYVRGIEAKMWRCQREIRYFTSVLRAITHLGGVNRYL